MIKTIQLEKGRLLAVEVPDGASDLTLPKVGMIDLYFQTKIQSENEEDNYISVALPDVGFETLGLATDITEDQAKNVVDEFNDNGLIKYKDYLKGYFTHSLFTPLESLQSLLQANKIYSVNPYYEPEIQYYMSDSAFTMSEYRSDLNKWQEAQQHVKNWFLLFKPKK